MPAVTLGIARNVPTFEAWRWAFFMAGAAQVIMAFLVLTVAQVQYRCLVPAGQPGAQLHCTA